MNPYVLRQLMLLKFIWEWSHQIHNLHVKINFSFYLLLFLSSILFPHKVDLLKKNRFGFDEAFNYKEEPDLSAALKSLVSICVQI